MEVTSLPVKQTASIALMVVKHSDPSKTLKYRVFRTNREPDSLTYSGLHLLQSYTQD